MIKKIVILFSGRGSNVENLITKLQEFKLPDGSTIEIAACITNKPDALGIEKVKKHHIPVEIIDHKLYDSRESFDQKLVETIETLDYDLVVMAGFMRILTPIFTARIKAINIHPSMLPQHKGAKAIEQSFESSDSYGGASVHWVTQELDAGEVILQKSFDKASDDTFESFKEKVHTIEYEIFPEAVKKVLSAL